MSLPPSLDWIFGAFAVASVLWTLVRSIRVRVRVRKLTPDEAVQANDGGPKLSLRIKAEQRGPIHFGTRTSPPQKSPMA